MYTTNNIQTTTQGAIQYQTADGTLKQPKIEGVKNNQQNQEFPTFCYANVNMIQKLTPTSQGTTVNLAQLTDDNKTVQYITQPFGYGNYALVNQMQVAQNGIAGIATVDGRQLIVNKPITANTISNISFKCDVCGLMFAHLTLLNQHKRTHNQDGDHNNEAITVVTQPQQLVQGQNIISESGQNLGQIQIVATESIESGQVIQQHSSEVIQQHKTVIDKSQKCITCGVSIISNPKRKGPKLIRCESCINNSMVRPTQIFVAPDGDIKFEVGELPITSTNDSSMDCLGTHSMMPITTTASSTSNHQAEIIEVVSKRTGNHFPVKKKNVSSVMKCNKCNGTGVIFIGGQSTNQQQTQSEKPFVCNICGGRFSRYSSLWSHKKLHTGEKNYKCNVCGIAFAKAVYLKNHTRIHTGEKPYKCQTCGMQFSQSPHLKNHERTHSGEKPYVCEVCDKGFARHATLWNHRRIHTGEKPYKCDRCQSAFSQAAHLKNHEKVHSGIKPFKCDICSASFADRFALKRHRGIHAKYGQTAPLHQVNAVQEAQKDESNDVDEKPITLHNSTQEVVISGI